MDCELGGEPASRRWGSQSPKLLGHGARASMSPTTSAHTYQQVWQCPPAHLFYPSSPREGQKHLRILPSTSLSSSLPPEPLRLSHSHSLHFHSRASPGPVILPHSVQGDGEITRVEALLLLETWSVHSQNKESWEVPSAGFGLRGMCTPGQ